MNPTATVLDSKVLVLNRSYLPVHVTSVRRAFSLLYQGAAHVVNEEYRTFDFQSWADLSVTLEHEAVNTVNRMIRVPRVILLLSYDRMPKRHVRFSRFNIFSRDNNTCQYCGEKFARHDLNLDHVVPRSQGGTSRWENIVCSCLPCNRRKGGRTPAQARMKLLRPPRRPEWNLFILQSVRALRYREWAPFLSTADVSYWNTELEA